MSGCGGECPHCEPERIRRMNWRRHLWFCVGAFIGGVLYVVVAELLS